MWVYILRVIVLEIIMIVLKIECLKIVGLVKDKYLFKR